MNIHIRLMVDGREAASATIAIDDYKLEPLTAEEREASVETAVRTWTDRHIEIVWETEGGPE
ncbi:hypothetical protein ACFFK0_17570 [Paenibacillus chartarius]|uniref:Uncharacterized protein n=1 Tax=Paenibacillus chartarius TaxID=747481 RepID=A0ABV6DNM3_9BACL